MKKTDMNIVLDIVILCEESQEVTKAFRALGHNAYSCDLKDCSGGHPEWHIKDDAIKVLWSRKWDLVIAHPTCTFLTNSGVRWLYYKDGSRNEKRWEDLYYAIQFFNAISIYGKLGNALGVENPIPHKYAVTGINREGQGYAGIGKYNQLIQPWQFGHMESKGTCLWLYNLPKLKHTNNVYKEMMLLPKKERNKVHYASPGKDRAEIRSKTYSGIAQAMAEQWSAAVIAQKTGQAIASSRQLFFVP